MKRRNLFSRGLALLLSIAMCLNLFPVGGSRDIRGFCIGGCECSSN
ncbi:MAG: hypothetical protein LUG99_04950 [Lachnospiraceae bacterium]|nr:hypothetical protein [Lachnospiraceae bacterium]